MESLRITQALSAASRWAARISIDPSAEGNAGSAAILCDRTDKGAVFFATSSVDPNVCDENIRRLLNNF